MDIQDQKPEQSLVTENKRFYRYYDQVYSTVSFDVNGYESYGVTEPRIELLEFSLVNETPCGYWITNGFTKRWISKRIGHYARPTKHQAWNDFLLRKKIQARIYQTKLNRALYCLSLPQPNAETKNATESESRKDESVERQITPEVETDSVQKETL